MAPGLTSSGSVVTPRRFGNGSFPQRFAEAHALRVAPAMEICHPIGAAAVRDQTIWKRIPAVGGSRGGL
jgi:hypothetical protein